MAYRFKLKESLRDGVRRISVEQIEKVLQAPHKGVDRAGWVHEARKTMKRTRALLKCVRTSLDEAVFRAENAALGEIGRGLSHLRDRDVIAQTMAALEGTDDKLDEALDWLSKRLHPPAGGTTLGIPSTRAADATVRRAIKALEKAMTRLGEIEPAGELVDTVGAGLRATQRTGREALARLEFEATDENVHDLRKAVQIYQRQQSLVYSVWPEMQHVRIESARALAQLLGEAQDLAVLASTAQNVTDGGTADASVHGRVVVCACRRKQGLIREAAMPMAARLFAGRPSAVERELKAGWAAALALGTAQISPAAGKSPARARVKRSQRATAQ